MTRELQLSPCPQSGGGECVELDTLPPAEIRALVEDSITRLIDPYQWSMLQRTEELERETLRKIWRKAA